MKLTSQEKPLMIFTINVYQVPVLEGEYHVDPEYKKEVNNELKKQIEENKNNKKKEKKRN